MIKLTGLRAKLYSYLIDDSSEYKKVKGTKECVIKRNYKNCFKFKWSYKMQSFDSIETYAYGTSKDLVSEKEEIKCNNVIKWYKQWLTLMML